MCITNLVPACTVLLNHYLTGSQVLTGLKYDHATLVLAVHVTFLDRGTSLLFIVMAWCEARLLCEARHSV